ncbi:MAG TPA: HIT domain-containing protein [Patescibacteria group bacterium]
MEDCIFCKIVKKELPAKFIYEDADVLVFPDIHPIRPTHLIIIPKEHIAELTAVSNPEVFQKLFSVVQKMITLEDLQGKGYRVSLNGGGAQVIDHLHIHLIGPMTKTAVMG